MESLRLIQEKSRSPSTANTGKKTIKITTKGKEAGRTTKYSKPKKRVKALTVMPANTPSQVLRGENLEKFLLNIR